MLPSTNYFRCQEPISLSQRLTNPKIVVKRHFLAKKQTVQTHHIRIMSGNIVQKRFAMPSSRTRQKRSRLKSHMKDAFQKKTRAFSESRRNNKAS
jgi:hypothetical protein